MDVKFTLLLDLLKNYKNYKKLEFKPSISIINITQNILMVSDLINLCYLKSGNDELIKKDLDILEGLGMSEIFAKFNEYNKTYSGRPHFEVELEKLIYPKYKEIKELINIYEAAYIGVPKGRDPNRAAIGIGDKDIDSEGEPEKLEILGETDEKSEEGSFGSEIPPESSNIASVGDFLGQSNDNYRGDIYVSLKDDSRDEDIEFID